MILLLNSYSVSILIIMCHENLKSQIVKSQISKPRRGLIIV